MSTHESNNWRQGVIEARVAALECPEAPRWIEFHGWRALEAGERQFIFVFITTVVKVGGPALTGERPPTDEQLASPGGATMEQLQRQGRPRIDEFYNDFDHRAPGEAAAEILFSYGEYVPSSEAVDFEPFVRKAEAMARHHYGPEMRIVRCDCFCATHPDVAVVHVFFTV